MAALLMRRFVEAAKVAPTVIYATVGSKLLARVFESS